MPSDCLTTEEHDTSVLIVDDAERFRDVARALLERRGYVVVGEADCAAAALKLADELAPDAVLLDIRLPDGTGFQVAAVLTLRQPALAVLLTSTDATLSNRTLVEESGARGFVGKAQLATTDLTLFWPSP